MKIPKYILIYLITVCSVNSQTQEWIVFKDPNLSDINYSSAPDWLSINIFGQPSLRTKGSRKYNSPINNFGLVNTTVSTIPGNSIICSVTDNKGNIWIGTEFDGLVKFDGTNWVQYNSHNSNLPDNTVYSLAVDINNAVWVGTRGGLARFKGTSCIVYSSSNSALPGDVVYSIAVEKNGIKWIGTSRGLARFDNRSWKIFNTRNSKIPGNFISALNIDQNGDKWIGTFEGLVKYDNNMWQRINSPGSGLAHGDIFSISFDDVGAPIIATWGSGYSTFNASGWNRITTENSSLPDNFVSSVLIDQKGTRWVGTLNGLMKCRGGRCMVYNSSNSPLPSDSVYSLLSDKNGNLWIGTNLGLAVFREGGLRTVPAEVTEFKAEVEDNEVLLSWKSNLDEETDRFEIEKKTEGTDWKRIGVVKKYEQTVLKSRYIFLDKHNNTGEYQYRLKKITVNGGIKFSSEIETLVYKPFLTYVKIDYMNKSSDSLVINFSVSKKGTTDIFINNKYGQRIAGWNYCNLKIDYYQIDFPLNLLPEGIYTLKMHNNNKVIVKKFVVY
jgi:ligand-binding sensor domain-containing protein